MKFFRKSERSRSPRNRLITRVRLEVESLEVRIVPYALSGGVWPHPEMVTISFMPDGTAVGTNANGYVYSNLFAKMNARFGTPAVWEAQILRAAQSWAVQTNLNFDIVPDNGTPMGQGAYQQGDPGMGDIRIGGYAFTSTYLASAAAPPPVNNYSIAGDMQFNTNISWHIGSTYDLFTVAAHEMGHALGLGHSTISSAEMYASYGGIKNLTSDDIAGIRANYSGGNSRTADATSNNSIATATDISSLISISTLTALAPTTDLSTTSDVDYYTFIAPTGSSSTLTVAIQSTGLSMLTPAVTLYAADGVTVLNSASDAGHLGGNTLTMTVSGVTAGEQFYVKVAGADSTVFSVGEYALSLNLGTGSLPTVPVPNTATLNGNPFHGGGGSPEVGHPGRDAFPFGPVNANPSTPLWVGQSFSASATSPTASLPVFVQPTANTQAFSDIARIERAITRYFAQEEQQTSAAADSGATDTHDSAADVKDGTVDAVAPTSELPDLFAADDSN